MQDFSQITELDLSNRDLTELPDLTAYTNLRLLNCCNNRLTELPNLIEMTPTLQQLYCWNNQLIYIVGIIK